MGLRDSATASPTVAANTTSSPAASRPNAHRRPTRNAGRVRGAVCRAERAEDQQGGELAEHQPAVAGVPELLDRPEADGGVGRPADRHRDEAAQGEATVPSGRVGQQPTASYHQQGDEGADPHGGGEDVQGQAGDGDLVVTGPGGVPGEGRGSTATIARTATVAASPRTPRISPAMPRPLPVRPGL